SRHCVGDLPRGSNPCASDFKDSTSRYGRRPLHCRISVPLCPLWINRDPGSRNQAVTHVRLAPKAKVGHQGAITSLSAPLRTLRRSKTFDKVLGPEHKGLRA